jgi:arylsulfatase A-like enzyme
MHNILVVLLDDVGIEPFRDYAQPVEHAVTPTFNRLGSLGVRFSRAYSTPNCTPARVQIHSGKYGFRTGQGTVRRLNDTWDVALSELRLPGLLNRPNACFGKWHITGGAQGVNSVYQHFDGASAQLSTGYTNWERNINGSVVLETEYATEVNVTATIDWINAQVQPWFCYLAFNSAHRPWHRPPDGTHSQSLPNTAPGGQDDPRPYWLAMIENVDFEMARLLLNIDLRTTTVIVLGDNGSPHQVNPQADETKDKGTVREAGIRVPMWAIGAGVERYPRRRVIGDLVSVVDVYATVLELAGVSPQATHDSISFAHLLADPSAKGARDLVYSEIFEPNGVGIQRTMHDRSLRLHDGSKLIRHLDGTEELYDVSADPLEDSPLSNSGPTYEELSAMLTELEQEW